MGEEVAGDSQLARKLARAFGGDQAGVRGDEPRAHLP